VIVSVASCLSLSVCNVAGEEEERDEQFSEVAVAAPSSTAESPLSVHSSATSDPPVALAPGRPRPVRRIVGKKKLD
jgi:hypothetical protein